MKKIVVISPSISAVHIRKRVKGLVDAGYEVVVYAFDRGDSASKEYPANVQVYNLGLIPNGRKYFFKFFKYIPILFKIFNQYKKEDCIYFVCAFDLGLITKLLARKKYIYHISDLVYGYFKPNIQPVFQCIDRMIINSSMFTVVTSEGFMEYLKTECNSDKFIYQPNNLSSSILDYSPIISKQTKISSLTFSFVGFVRFESIFRFAKVIGQNFPNHKFIFYGKCDSVEQISLLTNQYTNIEYKGAFRSPDDLPSIYSNIDILVSCYDTSSLNVRLAEPNKLFEAIYFNKPIIVSSNTYLASKVNAYGIGYSVDANSETQLVEFIQSLEISDLTSKFEQLKIIDRSNLIDDNSHGIVSALDRLNN